RGAATTGLGRPFGKKGGEGGFRRRGQFGRAAREQLAWCPLEPIATERAHPGGDGLLVDAQDPCALCETLAIHDGKDGEEMRDLAQVTQLLGRLELPFHGFAGASGESKTDAAPRDTPPKTTCERGFFGRHFPDVWPLVNLSSEILFLKVYSSVIKWRQPRRITRTPTRRYSGLPTASATLWSSAAAAV